MMKSFLKMIFQIMRRLDYIILYRFYCCILPVHSHQVLFLSDSRKEMSGNFAFIYDAICHDYDIKMHLYQSTDKHPRRQMCKDMAQSRYILVDDYYPIIYPIPLRKKTRLIQVWHAVGAFKTVGFARRQNHDRFSITHRNYTDTIVSSEMIRKDYARAFRMDVAHVHSLGIPRTDVFFDENYIMSKRQELYQLYPFLKDKKVVLFAPTFRGNNVHKAYYDFDKIDFHHFCQSLSHEYFCIIKMHPFIRNFSADDLDPSFYLNLSSQREINDLLLITDILITDYSSVIFEASMLDIYTIFYAYDLQDYTSSRDFFYPYDQYTYGPVVKDQNQLEEAILHPLFDRKKKERFQQYFMSSCDGHATERFVEKLLKEDK